MSPIAILRYRAMWLNLHEANAIAPFVRNLARMGDSYPRLYVVTSESGSIAGQLLGLYSRQYYSDLATSLRRSTYFQTVFDKNGTQMFELKPTAHR